jgi:arylsulfatase A-like enzyme
MKRRYLNGALAAAICGLAFVSVQGQPAAAKPNIVLIITDDVGYGDLGSYGAPDIKTPSIDSLAKAGVKMTHFYANASSCTPTRAGLITGRYQQRYALEYPLSHESGVDRDRGLLATGRSFPQLLKNSGYATALLGKWHLGYRKEFSPLTHGFDSFFGFKSGFIDYYQHTDFGGNSDLFENDRPVKIDGYMTDLITERAVRFISTHANAPFFLEVAYNAAHWPYQVPDHPSTAIDHARHLGPADENTGTRADYVKMMERADRGVGEILAALDSAKLAPNTLVIFTNDNGGEWLSRNAPLFNRKFSLYEGGIRVPAILRWPGHLPAGVTSTQVGITMDLSATILAAANAQVPSDAKLEGIDLVPLLNAKQTTPRTLFWRVTTVFNQRAVRDGSWKLIVQPSGRADGPDPEKIWLFDVVNDPGERNDLTAANTAVVRRLRQRIAAWEKDVDSEAKGSAR